mgnify:FL=1
MVKFDYKLLLLWHINEISHISSKYFEREAGGQIVDPDKEYKRSVYTLRNILKPYLDDAYLVQERDLMKDGMERMTFKNWSDLLGELMCLLNRKQWLVNEDLSGEDDDLPFDENFSMDEVAGDEPSAA